jgi:hypothetical protein
MSLFGIGRPDIDKMLKKGDSRGLLKTFLDHNHPEYMTKVAEAFGPRRIYSIASSGIIDPPFSKDNDPQAIDIDTRGGAFIALALLGRPECKQAMYDRIVQGFSLEEVSLFGRATTVLAAIESNKVAVSALLEYLESANFQSLDFSKPHKEGSGILLILMLRFHTLPPDSDQARRLESVIARLPLEPGFRTTVERMMRSIPIDTDT